MFYQLVLITNLGLITPLVHFPTFEQCISERAKIGRSAQYSAECLPTQNPQQLIRMLQENQRNTPENIVPQLVPKDKK